MNYIKLFVSALLVVPLLAQGPRRERAHVIPARAVVDLASQFWAVSRASGYGSTYNTAAGALAFDFERTGRNTNNYLVSNYSRGMDVGAAHFVSVSVEVTAGAGTSFDFPPNGGTTPPSFHLYLANCLFCNSTEYRWWSREFWILKPGTHTFVVPIDPSAWSDLYGERGDLNGRTVNGFEYTMSHLMWVGGTFGGGNYFGHGVSASGGDATFRITNYSFF
jgi:hypothetical protein